MLKPMQNINQGGYVPPCLGTGCPSASPFNTSYNPAAPPAGPDYDGFSPENPSDYGPVPEMPPYDEAKPDFQGQGGRAPHRGQNPPPYYGDGRYHRGPRPIETQPREPRGQGEQSMEQMGRPMGPPGDSTPTRSHHVPHGLEYLSTVNQLLVKQELELLEIYTGFETKNKYTIKNAFGQEVYYAVEDSDCFTRNWFGPCRPFDMRIFDNSHDEVIHLYRPFRWCLQTMEISAPPGHVVGYVDEEWTFCKPAYRIKNQSGDTVLRIEGPCCTCSCGRDVEFNVVNLTGEHVGRISKQWSGFVREFFTDADFFGITFPMSLDVRLKAVLLGALFLIDMCFYEI